MTVSNQSTYTRLDPLLTPTDSFGKDWRTASPLALGSIYRLLTVSQVNWLTECGSMPISRCAESISIRKCPRLVRIKMAIKAGRSLGCTRPAPIHFQLSPESAEQHPLVRVFPVWNFRIRAKSIHQHVNFRPTAAAFAEMFVGKLPRQHTRKAHRRV